MTEQFIEIAGKQVVLLEVEEFKRLAEDAENYRDICAAVDANRRKIEGEEYLPASMVDRLLAGESPLKVWRQHRGLTLEALGEKVGCQASWIGKLEKGQNEGGIKLWQSLAKALDVELADIVIDN